MDEAARWEAKAKELDEEEQEEWRKRVAESIVSSPWGANEAAVDHITEWHKKELAVLRKTHSFKRYMIEKRHLTRKKNLQNAVLSEERKLRIQCRKQAILRLSRGTMINNKSGRKDSIFGSLLDLDISGLSQFDSQGIIIDESSTPVAGASTRGEAGGISFKSLPNSQKR
jgi:hypothetical protein